MVSALLGAVVPMGRREMSTLTFKQYVISNQEFITRLCRLVAKSTVPIMSVEEMQGGRDHCKSCNLAKASERRGEVN